MLEVSAYLLFCFIGEKSVRLMEADFLLLQCRGCLLNIVLLYMYMYMYIVCACLDEGVVMAVSGGLSTCMTFTLEIAKLGAK